MSVDAPGGALAVVTHAAIQLRRGRFEDALSHLRHAKALRDPSRTERLAGHAATITILQAHARRCLAVEPDFDRHLQGENDAGAIDSSCDMAFVAYAKGEYAISVDVYGRVAPDDHGWNVLGFFGHRFWAACATGRLLREGAVSNASELRANAYHWLEEELRAVRIAADHHGPQAIEFLRTLIRIDDLEPFREFSRMPPDEASSWRQLWSDAEDLVRRLD